MADDLALGGDAAAQRVEELVLAVALEPGNPDELAGRDLEVDRLPARSERRPRDGQNVVAEPLARRRGRVLAPARSSWSAPVIRCTSSRGVQSPRSSVATVSPERMTVMRSPISSISSMRCVMKIDADALGAEP